MTDDEMRELVDFCERHGVRNADQVPTSGLFWLRKADEYLDCLRMSYRENGRLVDERRELWGLINDMLALILGWAWMFNTLAGFDREDDSTVPMREFLKFQARATELGVPDE